jgi:hypothetical protein
MAIGATSSYHQGMRRTLPNSSDVASGAILRPTATGHRSDRQESSGALNRTPGQAHDQWQVARSPNVLRSARCLVLAKWDVVPGQFVARRVRALFPDKSKVLHLFGGAVDLAVPLAR